MKKKFLLSFVASGISLSGMSFGLVTKHIDNAYAVDSKEEAKYDKFLGYVTMENHQFHFISGSPILSFVDRNGKKIDIPDYKFVNVRANHEADPTGFRGRTNPIRNSLSENVWTHTRTNAFTGETSTEVERVQVYVFFWDGKDNTKVMGDKYFVKNTNGVLSYELVNTGIDSINNFRGATGDPIYLGLKEKMKVTPTAPIKPSEKANAGANNNAGTEVKPNNGGNANAGTNNNPGTEVKPNNDGNANAGTNNNAGTNSSSAVAPAPTPVKPETKVYTEAEIEALQNKAADLEKEVAELEKLIAENENNPDAVDYVTAAKNKLEDKKAELEKKEAELEEALKGLEPKVESSNGTEAPINNVPELGNVDKLKIEAEIEQLKEQIKDGEENGAEPYYIEGLKARLADLEEALEILAANKPAVNEVPEFDLSKLPQPAPGAAGPDFSQRPQGDGNSFGPKTEAKEEAKAETKEGTLPNTGMTTSSTVALGLSLIALVGLAVRRKLNN
ncbi:LPXTG cell wall anchor domain-containing protein [uncultured Gemella sp.]|uniref:LPXTG cell wall anchor domain-containing protein n=1 Tax=uncultured Gemella sp. TaxID=254352 RepID=UPI0028D87528|nr:LPXTG cell wall anchor domain-containing protein [uncultured Gemella sp.]